MERLDLKSIITCNRRKLAAVAIGAVAFASLAWGAGVVHLPSVVTSGVQVTGQTALTAPIFDASKNLVSSSTTSTELGYVHGVTSALCGISDTCTLTNKSIDASQLTGSIGAALLPNPSASTLGGIESYASVSHQWINAISTSGVPASTQPAFSDISGTASLTTQVTGVLPIANGGTNNGSLAVTAGGVLYTDGSKLVNVGAGTSGQVLTSAGASEPIWAAASGAGGLIGDREMITNTGIEIDASGYTAYADAAGALPVDCQNGSPSSSKSRSTTTPITNTGELLWTKSGSANRQGEGVSIPFTVGTADQAKVLQLDIDSIVRSGTFTAGASGVDSDLEFYIYDATNSTVIQPTTYKIYSNNSTIPLHTTANFQTSATGTSYFLCIHTATTTTSIFTVGFDNISIHPSRYVYGTPITDWKSWTPTGGWSSNTTYTGFYRRVGDSAEFQVHVALAGAPTSATLSINLPSGMTIDTSKLGASVANRELPQSSGSVSDSGVNVYKAMASYASSTSINAIYLTSTTGIIALVTQAAPFTFGNADFADLSWSVPIVGWSSSVQMSDSANTRTIALILTGSSTSITSSGNAITPTTVTKDSHAAFSGTTWTSPVAGFYQLNATMGGGSVAQVSGDIMGVYYKLNSGSVIALGLYRNTASITTSFYASGSAVLYLNAGDTIQFYGVADKTQTISVFQASIISWPGAASIGATETVAATYQNTNAQSVSNNTLTTITGWTKIRDTHSFCTTSGVCTLPAAGAYRASETLGFAVSSASTGVVQATIVQAGSASTTCTSSTPFGSAGNSTVSVVSCTFVGQAGDTLTFRGLQNNGGSLSLSNTAAFNTMSVERVGL